jgi:hypothetical protein
MTESSLLPKSAAGAEDGHPRHGAQCLPEVAVGVGTTSLGDWITVLWLVACLLIALVSATIGVLERDLAVFAPSAIATVGLAWLVAVCRRAR